MKQSANFAAEKKYTAKATKVMNENNEKKAYVKPEFEVIDLNNDLPILCASAPDFGNGGRWGF